MKKKPTPRKTKPEKPRPAPTLEFPVIIDTTAAYEYARVQCSDAEIAEIMNCSIEELQAAMGARLKVARALGIKAIRTSLYNLATSEIGKAPQVAIWLSKQYLGMMEPEKKEEDDGDVTIEVVSYKRTKKG